MACGGVWRELLAAIGDRRLLLRGREVKAPKK